MSEDLKTQNRTENGTPGDNNNLSDTDTGEQRKRSQSDLRQTALLCHNQISKELWGKKHANSFVDHLRPPEVEAFALDIALRFYWDLQKDRDEFAQCSLSHHATAELRQLALSVLRKYQEELTQIYSFEIPDPRAVREREEKKQQQLEAQKLLRKQRAEEAKREREARAARMKEQRLAAAREREEKAKLAAAVAAAAESPSDSTPVSTPKKIVQKSIVISKPPPKASTSIKSPGSLISGTEKKSFSRPPGLSVTPKKSITIQPPPKRSKESQLSVAAFAARSKEKKSFTITPPPKKTIITPSSSATSTRGGKVNSMTSSIKGSSNSAIAAFQKKKKEKTFTRPPLTKSSSEEEPIPNITLKQTLVNTEKLVPLIQEAIAENFSVLNTLSQEERTLDFYHWSEKGPRPANEDEYTIVEHVNELVGLDKDSDKFAFFGAYDGHCGKYTSLFIRSQIHHKVCSHPRFPEEMDKAIHESIIEIDRLANDIQERDEFACGSTALAVWVRNNEELIVGNVGDCRGFICRNGKPTEIADPHHPNRVDEKRRIEANGGAVVKRGAWRVNGILAVSRSIGDNNLKKFVIPDPEITRFQIQPEDEFVIIASDGLWDVLKPEEVIDLVHETCRTQGRKYVCPTLCEEALRKDSKDNVTVVVLFFNRSKTG